MQYQYYPSKVSARSTRIVEGRLQDSMIKLMSYWQTLSSTPRMYQFSLRRLIPARHQNWVNKCSEFVQASTNQREIFTLNLLQVSPKRIAFTASPTYQWVRSEIAVHHPWITQVIESLHHSDSSFLNAALRSYIKHSLCTELKPSLHIIPGWAPHGWFHALLLKSTRTASTVDCNQEVRNKSAQVYTCQDR